MTLVSAVISVCMIANPGQCEKHQFQIEKRVCGLSARASVPISGEWQPAVARIICSK